MSDKPDLLVVRPYRARYRDIKPGDNAGPIVRWFEGWRAVEQRDELSQLMVTPPGA